MKKYLPLFALLTSLSIAYGANSDKNASEEWSVVTCPTGNVTLLSQSDVNTFVATYPGCTVITGQLNIGPSSVGDPVTDLSGLSSLLSVTGGLNIIQNPALASLIGLHNVSGQTGLLVIQDNPNLNTLVGLNKLQQINSLRIINNDNLTGLTSLNSLELVSEIIIKENDVLLSLDGLDNLIPYNTVDIEIVNNQSLSDISSLNILAPGFINLNEISGNSNLSNCDVIAICDYFINGGTSTIHSNATGCNTQSEIENTCGSSTVDYSIFGDVRRATGIPLTGVNLTASGDLFINQLNDADASYYIPNIPAGSNLTVSAEKTSELSPPEPTITLADIAKVRKWVLLADSPSSMCEVVALDMDRSGFVSTYDVVLMGHVLLGDPNPYAGWNIVPSDMNWGLGYDDQVSLYNINSNQEVNFTAIWPGAVQECGAGDPPDPAFVAVSVSTPASAAEGCGQVEIPITVDNAVDIQGIQFSVEWDPQTLQFVSVSSIYPDGQFNINSSLTDAGKLTYYWSKFSPTTLPNGTLLFNIQFHIIGGGANTDVSIVNTPTDALAIDDQLALSGLIISNLSLPISTPTCSPLPSLSCNPAVQVTIDGPFCTTALTPDLLLTGDLGCLDYSNFSVTVQDGNTADGEIMEGLGPYTYEVTLPCDPGGAVFTTCTGTVTGIDQVLPVPVCEDFLNINLNTNYTATISVNSLDDGSYDPCGGAITLSASQTTFTCADAGQTLLVELTVTDAQLQTNTCSSLVYVNPPANPINANYRIRFPSDGIVDCVQAINNADVFTDGCGLFAINVDDVYLTPSAGDCFKIERTYDIVNWLEWNGSSPPVVIRRDEDCNGIAGDEDIWVLRRPGGAVYLDGDGDETNGIPAANTKNTSCDGLTNPVGYWISKALATGATPPRNLTSTGYWRYTRIIRVQNSSGPTINPLTPTGPYCVTDFNNCEGSVSIFFYLENLCTPNSYQLIIHFDENNDGIPDQLLDNNQHLSGSLPLFTINGVFPEGQHAFLVEAHDGCNGMNTFSIPFEVDGNCGPTTIECPAPITHNLTTVECGFSTPDLTGQVVTLCGSYTQIEQSPPAGTLLAPGMHTITLIVTNAGGYVSSCTTDITVNGTQPQVDAVCQDMTITLGTNGTISLDPYVFGAGSTNVCPNATWSLSQSLFDCNDSGIGPIAVTLTIDNGSNSDQCTADVTVDGWLNDTPEIVCQPLGLNITPLGTAFVWATDFVVFVDDDCTANPAITYDDGQLGRLFTCADVGTQIITIRATDDQGAYDFCVTFIQIQDNFGVCFCQDKTITLNSSGQVTLTSTDVVTPDALTGGGTFSLSQTVFDCDDLGTNVVTVTQDLGSNITTCDASVVVLDGPPILTCQNATLSLNSFGQATLIPANIILSATDDCGITNYNLSQSQFTCTDLGATNVTLTVTDGNSHSTSCNAVVTITGLPCEFNNPGTTGVGSSTGSVTYNPTTGVFSVNSLNNAGPPTSDNVYFIPSQLCGDGEIIAEVTSVTNSGFAGIMMRETLAPGAKKFAVYTNFGANVRREIRVNTNGPASIGQIFRPNTRWLRIRRVGNTFTAFSSTNGTSWNTLIGANIGMGGCIQVGLATYSLSPAIPVLATFDNVQIIDYVPLIDPSVGDQYLSAPEVGLFPNPTTGEVTLQWGEALGQSADLDIFDSSGRLVYHRRWDIVDQTRESLDLSALENGLYLVRIAQDDVAPAITKLVMAR